MIIFYHIIKGLIFVAFFFLAGFIFLTFYIGTLLTVGDYEKVGNMRCSYWDGDLITREVPGTFGGYVTVPAGISEKYYKCFETDNYIHYIFNFMWSNDRLFSGRELKNIQK